MICWFMLTSCVFGLYVVRGASTFYQAEKNKKVTIKWDSQIKPDMSSTNLVCVFKSEVNRVLFHMMNGVEVPESQDEQFAGRVQWDKNVLREGRLRLHVSRLRTEDSGNYWCKLTTIFGKTIANETFVLNVTTTKSRLTTHIGPKHLPGGPKQDHGYYNLLTTELGWIAPFLVVVALLLCMVTQISRCQQQDPDQPGTSSPAHLTELTEADII
ncbi:uncharacterized protein LOC144513262 isoform X2 [Sander vitreus]